MFDARGFEQGVSEVEGIGYGVPVFEVGGFVDGVSGSWFRDLVFLQVRGFEYGVSGSGFPGMGFRARGCGGSGTAFLVICSGFSRFGVSGSLFRVFQVWGFAVRGFRVRVFNVRGFG